MNARGTGRILIAFAIGAVVASGLSPAVAGGRAGLMRRVVSLERQVSSLQTYIDNSQAATDLRLDALESATQMLDEEGTYYGFVDAVQVWSHYCEGASGAVWRDFEGYAELSCESPEAAGARLDDRSSPPPSHEGPGSGSAP